MAAAAAIGVVPVVMTLTSRQEPAQTPWWRGIVFLFLGLASGAVLLAWRRMMRPLLLALWGRPVLEVRGDTIRAGMRFRRIEILRSEAKARIRRLYLQSPGGRRVAGFIHAQFWEADLRTGSILWAEREGAAPLPLAAGCTRETLLVLVDALLSRWAAPVSGASGAPERPVVVDNVRPETEPENPLNTRVRVERRGGLLEVEIPARGLDWGMFGFGLLWTSAALVPVLLIATGFGKGGDSPSEQALAVGFLLAMSIPGVGALVGSLRIGSQRLSVVIEKDRVQLTRRTLLRVRRRELATRQIRDVRCERKKWFVNEVSDTNLFLRTDRGEDVLLWQGLDRRSLEWLAGELRRALQRGEGRL